LRVVISHHGTFFINSLCHMIGRQPYSREHSARDSAVMAVLAFGEGYHNYHHSFPFDYRNGIKGWQFDPAKWAIFCLSRLGLAHDLRRASDASILKAKVEVEFETAKEKMARLAGGSRQIYEKRLYQGFASLQAALQELLALQRRSGGVAAAGNLTETPPRRIHHPLDQALREWRQTLRQMNHLPTAAPSS
jgi:stearoyl-CoA desaturase (delta-9 desaturase)